MSCFVGLILIAGTYLNPCLVTHMKNTECYQRDDSLTKLECCYVEFNSGNAWSGTDNVIVPTSCDKVQDTIKNTKKP